MAKKLWWSKGIQFHCQGSGKCCVSRGGYGYVYLTLADRRRFAAFFGLSTVLFTKRYCLKTDGYYHLKNGADERNCVFLDGKQCAAYEGRPTQCRTWPFWPEVMSPKAWSREVAAYCPGVGKGPVIPAETIAQQLATQKRSEADR